MNRSRVTGGKASRPRGKLPPGPRSKLLTTYRLVTDPFGSLSRWLARYGDPFTLPIIGGDLVITAKPENIKRIYGAEAETFDVAEAEALKPLVGEYSVMVVDGERHRRARKLLAPPFGKSYIRDHGQTITRLTSDHTSRLEVGSTVNMLTVVQELAVDIIINVVFGIAEPEHVRAFGRALVNMTEAAHPSFLFAPVLQRDFGGFGPWARYRRAADIFDRMLYAQIARSRADGGERSDVLGLLLAAKHEDGTGMSDAELRSQLLTIAVAGHEPTALSLGWTLYWIHRTPGVRERLVAELDGLGAEPDPLALSKLPYLNAVISEAMRIIPIVPYTSRRLKEPFELDGFVIPAGASVAPATALAHAREEVFPDAGSFKPERFLDQKYSIFEYIPFSGGERRCLGASFATFEMAIVLGLILRAYHLELADGSPIRPRRRNLLMGPGDGVPMRVIGRRGAAGER